jgi:hypothetical protein
MGQARSVSALIEITSGEGIRAATARALVKLPVLVELTMRPSSWARGSDSQVAEAQNFCADEFGG